MVKHYFEGKQVLHDGKISIVVSSSCDEESWSIKLKMPDGSTKWISPRECNEAYWLNG
jgi:hypothetical protein